MVVELHFGLELAVERAKVMEVVVDALWAECVVILQHCVTHLNHKHLRPDLDIVVVSSTVVVELEVVLVVLDSSENRKGVTLINFVSGIPWYRKVVHEVQAFHAKI